MFSSFIKFAVVLPLIYLIMIIGDNSGNDLKENIDTENPWNVAKFTQNFIDQYGGPIGKHCIDYLYNFYSYLTFTNLILFVFKYISMTTFLFTCVQSFYCFLREKRTTQKLKLVDIQLQEKVMKEKIKMREKKITEQTEHLQRAMEQLRGVRARVSELILNDEGLRGTYGNLAKNPEAAGRKEPEEEKFLLEIMNGLIKYDYKTSKVQNDNMDCGEYVPPEPSSPDASVYSSANENQKDCIVKIVKVTNVYKVSYLRHFIKQKRLKRATKQAQLKKKMEDIKKLLEDWQKTLNMVINSKVASYAVDSNQLERAPQEAMGDFSKPQLRESSDSDSELSWNQNSYRKSMYCFQDPPEMSKEYYDPRDYMDVQPSSIPCDWNGTRLQNNLFIVAEETSSQMAIHEVKSEDGEDWDCRDISM